MKADVFAVDGKKTKSVDLPAQFTEQVRPDIIKRAVKAIQSHNRQPYGAFPDAGQRASAKLSRRRKNYRGAYNIGISRVPRKIIWKRGRQFGWMGAYAPGMIKGRRAHPPKAARNFAQHINTQERKKAIRSALAATTHLKHVQTRGHKVEQLATVIETKAEELAKVKDVYTLFIKLGFGKELARIAIKKVRAGKGKVRGRKYKIKKGPLLVVSKPCKLQQSAKNLQGVDICNVRRLNTELLAPGGVPGRLTLFTEDALNVMKENNLFTHVRKEKQPKTAKKVVKKTTKKVTKKTVKKETKQ